MKVRIVKPGEVERMCAKLRERGEFGFDTETTDLDPYSGELRLMQFSPSPEVAYVMDMREMSGGIPEALVTLLGDADVTKIIHNAKFDCKWVKHHLGIEIQGVFDTLICSKIEGRGDKTLRHSLKDCLERHLGVEVDKTEQRSDWSAAVLSDAQIEYAAKDVCVLHALRDRLWERITQFGMEGCAVLENSIVPAMAALELNGFYLDAPAWRQLVVAAKAQEIRLADTLQDVLYTGSRQMGLFGRVEVDLGSWQQVGDALLRLGVPLDGRSTREDKIEHLSGKFPVVDKLLEWRGVNKSVQSYGDNILELIHDVTGRIHADFNQIEAPSGRMGCIAEGTLVDVPGGRKPIEEIQVGEYVYCYTEDGKPTLKKVTNHFYNGVKECSELTWVSSGDRSQGTLVATPDHEINSRERGWVRLDELKRGEKLFHIRRGRGNRADGSVRIKLYGAYGFEELEEHTIKREYFGAESRMHTHHVDEDPSNNQLSNLEIKTPSQHSLEHWQEHREEWVARSRVNIKKAQANRPPPRHGPGNPLWKPKSRFTLLRMLATAKGRPSKVPMDFDVFRNKCRLEGLDIKAVTNRYSSKGVYLNKRNVQAAVISHALHHQAAKALGVGYYKLKSLCEQYEINPNHAVVSVKSVGERRVYDLEVEGVHNYIAGEICVHNCRNPNLQNIPQDENYRRCFRAAEGKKLVVADYSQIELRVLADFSEDKAMIAAFSSGQDYHTATAATVFNVSIDKVKSEQRTFAKRVNFGVAYGIGVGKLSRMTGMDWDTTEAFLKKYFAALPDMDRWLKRSSYKTLKTRQAKTMSGRIARWEHLNPEDEAQAGSLQRLGKNTPIQGSAADIFKRGLYLIHADLLNTSAKIVNLVHDEYVIECDAAEAEAVAERTKTLAEQAGAEYLKHVPVKVDVKVLDQWQK